jgi:glycosyltransferase involved in cell wall biosynthesis
MKVGLDVSAVPQQPAGAGRYIVELAQRLPHHLPTELLSRSDDIERWKAIAPQAEILGGVPTNRLLRLLYERELLGTSRAVKGVDVWHSPHYTMPHRSSRPTAVTIHDLTFFTNPEWHEPAKARFFRQAIRYAAKHADVLISVSEFTAQLLSECVPTKVPVVVAPHGVDLEHFAPVGVNDEVLFVSAGLSESTPYILFVGTLEPRKGLDVLLHAFAELARENDEIELWIAGQMGWGESSFAPLLERHPVRNRIKRLGFVSEELLPALLRRAEVVAYPSRGEGFGLPVLEAMACGASVITSAKTVMAEIAGPTARYSTLGEAGELAQVLAEALAEPFARRKERTVAARLRAQQFTWDASIAQHLEAYRIANG